MTAPRRITAVAGGPDQVRGGALKKKRRPQAPFPGRAEVVQTFFST
jgi:hypothetical protein